MWIKIGKEEKIKLINLNNCINIEIENNYDEDDYEYDKDEEYSVVFNTTDDNEIYFNVKSLKKAIKIVQIIEDAIISNYSKILNLDDLLEFKTFEDFIKSQNN